jgi:hypothetical protein
MSKCDIYDVLWLFHNNALLLQWLIIIVLFYSHSSLHIQQCKPRRVCGFVSHMVFPKGEYHGKHQNALSLNFLTFISLKRFPSTPSCMDG